MYITSIINEEVGSEVETVVQREILPDAKKDLRGAYRKSDLSSSKVSFRKSK